MIKGYKSISMIVAIALLVMVIAGCVGTKAPDARLDITARAASGLIITNNGGNPLALNNEKITVKREVNNNVVDGLNAVLLFGNSPEFQDTPVIEKLSAGQTIKHTWKESLKVGEVLVITIQDVPSGNMIVDTRVTVS